MYYFLLISLCSLLAKIPLKKIGLGLHPGPYDPHSLTIRIIPGVFPLGRYFSQPFLGSIGCRLLFRVLGVESRRGGVPFGNPKDSVWEDLGTLGNIT